MSDDVGQTAEATPEAPQEFVALPDASDAELDSALDLLVKGEKGLIPDAEEAKPEAETPPENEPEKPQEAAPQGNDTSKPATEEDYAKLREQLAQQEQFIKRRNGEIGSLRQQLTTLKAQLQETLDERFAESPKEGMKDARKIEEIDQHLGNLDSEEQRINNIHQAQVLVSKHIKPGEVTMDDVVETLKGDGIDPNYIEQFAKSPFENALPETIVHLYKRAKAESMLRKLYAITIAKDEQIKKLKGNPNEVLANIERAANQGPSINGKTGGSSNGTKPSMNPALASDEEINQFLKSSR